MDAGLLWIGLGLPVLNIWLVGLRSVQTMMNLVPAWVNEVVVQTCWYVRLSMLLNAEMRGVAVHVCIIACVNNGNQANASVMLTLRRSSRLRVEVIAAQAHKRGECIGFMWAVLTFLLSMTYMAVRVNYLVHVCIK